MEFMKPYLELMRLHRPTGIWLLLFPCLYSLGLASAHLNLSYIFLFTLGALLMRGAGCTFNDLIDLEIDKKVLRTKDRPLARGALSKKQAIIFLIFQLGGALWVLLHFNRPTQLLGASSLIFVGLYPFMKRYTYWPQLFLGITFNWGALLGEMALHGKISPISILLYVTCLFWTLAYDTLYAYQDYKDDLKAGIKSTALRFGTEGKFYISLFYGVMLLGWGVISLLSNNSFLLLLTFGVGGILFFRLKYLNLQDPSQCLRAFNKNQEVGLYFLAGIFMSNLLK